MTQCEEVLAASARAFKKSAKQDRDIADDLRERLD